MCVSYRLALFCVFCLTNKMRSEQLFTTSSDHTDWNTTPSTQTDTYEFLQKNGSAIHYIDDYLSEPVKILFNVLFPSIMVIGVVGNVMVIIVIVRTKVMHNSTNILLANLAVADIIGLVIRGPEEIFDVNSIDDLLDMSEGTCYALTYIWDVLTFVSVLTILAISFERYYAICQPLRAGFICTKTRAYIICFLSWAIAALSASPRLSFKVYLPENYLNYAAGCYESGSSFRTSYYIIFASVFFFLPLIVLVVLYIIIRRHLCVALAPDINIAAIRNRRHVITMLITVIVCFFVCLLPFTVRMLLRKFLTNETIKRWLGVEAINSFFYLSDYMVFVHSAVNPILYNLMSERFRAGFKSIVCDAVNWCNGWRRR